MSESKKDVVLARNLLFPKLKAVDFHSIEFNSSNPQEDIFSATGLEHAVVAPKESAKSSTIPQFSKYLME